MEKKLNVPIKDESLNDLKAGDVVYLTGNIITARDQAHKRMIEQGSPLDIAGAAISFVCIFIKARPPRRLSCLQYRCRTKTEAHF